MASLLIDFGAYPDAHTEHGSTALVHAARAGRLDMMHLLRERGAALLLESGTGGIVYNGSTPLSEALFACTAGTGDLAVARRLLDAGADVNFANPRWFDRAPLLMAA